MKPGPARLGVVLWLALAACDGGPIVGWSLDRPDPTEHPATVTLTRPGDDGGRVAVDATLSARFSQEMAPGTIDADSFTLHAESEPVEGVVRYDGTSATFDPVDDLAFDTRYTAVLRHTVTNTQGHPLASDHAWTFTTQAEPDPDSPGVVWPHTYLYRRSPW